MSIFEALLQHDHVPNFYRVENTRSAPKLEDVAAETRRVMQESGTLEQLKPGQSVCIAAGSREIANIALIVRTVCEVVREHGAEPFIIPAMGSHAGAQAEGQKKILADFGITEEYTGAPIRSSMETVQVGVTKPHGFPARIDRYAAEADWIIPIGRIKPHTDIRGPIQSGILKMIVIGMGKQHGAYQCHKLGFKSMAANVKEFAGAIIEKKPNMFAIGLIENAYHQTCRIEAIPAGRILEEEPPLLDYAKSRMAKIPFDQADILFVDETGKDISGAGMDPNVTGRSPVLGISRPFFQRIAVFDLTDKSHGNFGGLGSADVTTQRLYRKIDFEQTYPNGITAAEPLAVRLPAVMPSDRTAMQFALRTATDCDWSKGPRIVWLKNTLSLSEFYISEALIPDAEALDNVTVVSEPMDVIFDEEGNVKELR